MFTVRQMVVTNFIFLLYKIKKEINYEILILKIVGTVEEKETKTKNEFKAVVPNLRPKCLFDALYQTVRRNLVLSAIYCMKKKLGRMITL